MVADSTRKMIYCCMEKISEDRKNSREILDTMPDEIPVNVEKAMTMAMINQNLEHIVDLLSIIVAQKEDEKCQ